MDDSLIFFVFHSCRCRWQRLLRACSISHLLELVLIVGFFDLGIAHDSDLNALDSQLLEAVGSGNFDSVSRLIEGGANVNTQSRTGAPPLMNGEIRSITLMPVSKISVLVDCSISFGAAL